MQRHEINAEMKMSKLRGEEGRWKKYMRSEGRDEKGWEEGWGHGGKGCSAVGGGGGVDGRIDTAKAAE